MLAAKASGDLLFIVCGFFVDVLRSAEKFGFGGGVGALAATGWFAHFFAGARL